jgi:hypothetical protein
VPDEGDGSPIISYSINNNVLTFPECYKYEMSNGTEKIKVEFKIKNKANIPWDIMIAELTYNGKTCRTTMVQNVDWDPDYLENSCKNA